MADRLPDMLRRVRNSEYLEKCKNKLPLLPSPPVQVKVESGHESEQDWAGGGRGGSGSSSGTGTALNSAFLKPNPNLEFPTGESNVHARHFIFQENASSASASIPPSASRPRKMKKRRHSTAAAAALAEAGPSRKKKRLHHAKDTPSHISIPAVALTPKAMASDSFASDTDSPIVIDQNQHIYHLERMFRKACDEVNALTAMIEKTKAECQQRELGVRQDLLFKSIMQQDRAEKHLQQERNKWSRTIASKMAEKEREIEKLNEAHEKTLQEERLRFNAKYHQVEEEVKKAKQDYNNMWTNCQIMQMHYDSSQSILRAIEGDLTELQRLENEERVERENQRKGLPPAYDTLADPKGYLPPYESHPHRDYGTLDLENLTQVAKTRYDQSLNLAIQKSLEQREGSDRRVAASAGSELFAAGSKALSAAAKDLDRVMIHALQMPSKRKQEKQQANGPGSSYAHATDIADHIAKLYIDFINNLFAAMELRGYCGAHMTSAQKLKNGLHFRNIDDIMLKLVRIRLENTVVEQLKPSSGCSRCDSHHCGGYCARLHITSYYLGAIKSIRSKIDKFCSRDRQGTHFRETLAALTDILETERAQAATAATISRARQPSPTPVMGEEEMAQAMRNSLIDFDEVDATQLGLNAQSMQPSFTSDSMLPSTAAPSFDEPHWASQQSSSAVAQPSRRSPRRATTRLTPATLAVLFSDHDDDNDNDDSDITSEHSEFHVSTDVQRIRRTNVTTRSQSRSARAAQETSVETAEP